jgi:hypothetical protein
MEDVMELKYVNCPTNGQIIKDIVGMFLYNDTLFINQCTLLTVWDVKDPTDIKKIHEYSFGNSRMNMKLFDNVLYLWERDLHEKEDHIVALDISNSKNIQQLFEIPLKDQKVKIKSLIAHNGKIFAMGDRVFYEIFKDGSSRQLFETQNINNTCDIIAHENVLITCGSSDGIRIFELANELILKKHIPVQFVIPTSLSWAEPGKTLLILGNRDENVLKIDVSVPEKAKRTKSAKTRIGLCKQYIRDTDCLLVFGHAIEGRQHNPKICVIDISGELPEFKNAIEIPDDYKQKEFGDDDTRGIIRIGKYILLATYSRQLGVVEIV